MLTELEVQEIIEKGRELEARLHLPVTRKLAWYDGIDRNWTAFLDRTTGQGAVSRGEQFYVCEANILNLRLWLSENYPGWSSDHLIKAFEALKKEGRLVIG